MATIEEIKKVLREEKTNLSRLGIERIGIFGSIIRGEARPDSDIDILIDLAPDSKLTLFSLIEIEQRLSEKLDSKIDLVLRSDLKPYIAERVLSEVVYVG